MLDIQRFTGCIPNVFHSYYYDSGQVAQMKIYFFYKMLKQDREMLRSYYSLVISYLFNYVHYQLKLWQQRTAKQSCSYNMQWEVRHFSSGKKKL